LKESDDSNKKGDDREKEEEEEDEEESWWLTREHHLHQISLLDVAGAVDQLQDVVGGGVVLEQQNLVINTVEAALWELENRKSDGLVNDVDI